MADQDLRDALREIVSIAHRAASSEQTALTNLGSVPDTSIAPGAFDARNASDAFTAAEPQIHQYGHSIVCETDSRGFATPDSRSPLELVVDASDGFIPLWASGVTLRWNFNEPSMQFFRSPEKAKQGARSLMAAAINAWGDAAPVRFKEERSAWDFEVVMRDADRCNVNGCTLASAFFPDGGRHQLVLYPQLFEQSAKEQVETLIHEVGHVFGLRHFFAKVRESNWPSEIYGQHSKFTIMNYGADSFLTEHDRNDLKTLYQEVWSGSRRSVNGTPIRLVRPFHDTGVWA